MLEEAQDRGLFWDNNYSDPHLYEYLWILRMLLLKIQNPLRFSRMLKLANFEGAQDENYYVDVNSKQIIKNFFPFLKNSVEDSELDKIFKIIQYKFRPMHFSRQDKTQTLRYE